MEEGMEMLIERLNAMQKYVEEIELWKQQVKSEYQFLKRKHKED